MKKIKLLYLLLIGMWLSLTGCEEEPYAMFTVSSPIVGVNETVTFTNSSEDADHYEWFFGDGATSTLANPTHSYSQEGAYIVTLVAYSKSGNKMDDAYQFYLFVLTPRNVTFTNPTYTPIEITLDGYGSRTIPVGENTTYQVFESAISFSASTSEKFSNGNPLALTISWSGTLELASTSQTFNLNVGTEFFYLYTTNACGSNIGPVYSNYGTSYQVYINCTLPCDGVKYNLGYHHARVGNELRWYINSTEYYYANQGNHFSYPNVSNQSVWITVGGKVSETRVDEHSTSIDVNSLQMPISIEYGVEEYDNEEGSIDIFPVKAK
ncbi:MAG TPA: PKD domain-containing protein, partial [Tenuifilaceae bacterium]|nr:PKD domain-containing protein [Tenuifilaceae bacterium]